MPYIPHMTLLATPEEIARRRAFLQNPPPMPLAAYAAALRKQAGGQVIIPLAHQSPDLVPAEPVS